MKRVLFLSRPFEGSFQGTGEQAVARELVRHIESDYPDINLITIGKHPVPPYKSILSICYYDYLVPLYFAIINTVRPFDLIICNSPYQGGLLWAFKARKTEIKTIIFDFFFMQNKKLSLFDHYAKVIYRISINSSKQLLLPTIESCKLLTEVYGRKSTLMPIGFSGPFDTYNFTRKTISKKIGYIGAYNRRKRPENFKKLASNLHASELHLYLAGNMPAELKEYFGSLKPGSGASVKILGILSDEEKCEFYQNITFFYYPTRLEGFGMQLMECFRAGVVPILHKDSIVTESLKKRCLLVNTADDVPSLIDELTADLSLYDKYVSNNLEYAKNFNWSNCVSKLLAQTTS